MSEPEYTKSDGSQDPEPTPNYEAPALTDHGTLEGLTSAGQGNPGVDGATGSS